MGYRSSRSHSFSMREGEEVQLDEAIDNTTNTNAFGDVRQIENELSCKTLTIRRTMSQTG